MTEKTADELKEETLAQREELRANATAEVSVKVVLTWAYPPGTSEALAERAKRNTEKFLKTQPPTNLDGSHIQPLSVVAQVLEVRGAVRAPLPAQARHGNWEPDPDEVNRPLTVVGA